MSFQAERWALGCFLRRVEECSTLGKTQHSSLSRFSQPSNHNEGAGLIPFRPTVTHSACTMTETTTEETLKCIVSEYWCLYQMGFPTTTNIDMKIMLVIFNSWCVCHTACIQYHGNQCVSQQGVFSRAPGFFSWLKTLCGHMV